MKRLLVRASAVAGLSAIAIFAVAQTHRAQPAAMGQERQLPASRPKKKAKSKAAAPGRQPPTGANSSSLRQSSEAVRYPNRYADRSADSALQPEAARIELDSRADFSDIEAPDAGPDLFPDGDAIAARPPRRAPAGDPFNKQSAEESLSGLEPLDEGGGVVPDRPTGFAPEFVDEPARPRTPKKTPAALARNNPRRAAAPQRGATAGHISVDRHVQPAADVFGPERKDAPTAERAAAISPRRDPFGDAAPGRQPIMGHGRPGHKDLEGAQSPMLVLEKVAPEEVQIGKAAVFAIHVQNTGLATAQEVEIHDVVPQGARLIDTHPTAAEVVDGRVSWTVGAIQPGEEATVEMELMPVAEGEIGSVATVHFAGEASARTRCTRPQLAIEASAPGEVLMGEEVTFSIRISNPGTGTATGIVLSETIPEQLEHPAGSELEYEVGDLKPGETRQIDLAMKTVEAGPVVNRLMARGDGQLQAEQQSSFMIVAPQLEVSMQGPKRRYLERQATYTVTVSNPGTAAAKEVQLVTHLPKGLKFIEANNAGEYDPATNSVHWALAELPAKEAGQVTLTTLPIEPGEQMLRVESVAERGLAAEQEEIVLVEGVAAILFQLADLSDPIEVGGETTYEIRVVNQGSKAATNVQLVAVFPPQIKPRSAHGPTRDSVEGQQVRFQPLGRLAPKGETTYQIRAQGLEPGDLRVQVQLMTDEMQSPVTKEESTRVYADE